MPSSEIVAKIKKYMEQLDREEKIRHALSRLDKVEMTLDLLQRTQVGKKVNGLCQHNIYGAEALRIVTKWKEIARKNGILPVQRDSPSSSEYSDRSDREDEEEDHPRTPSPVEMKPVVRPIKEEYHSQSESPPPCSSSFSNATSKSIKVEKRKRDVLKVKKEEDAFSRMLSAEPPKPKKAKREFKDEINYNYRPLPALAVKPEVSVNRPGQFLDVLYSEEMRKAEEQFKPRNEKARVFAGRRKKVPAITEVPKLYDSCLKVIGENIDKIDECGDIPFYILKPVLERCTVKQLLQIESKNPHFEEDSHELWERFFTKAHPGEKPKKKETFKEAYLRMEKRNEQKLAELNEKISSSYRSEESKTHKTAMISEAYAPLSVRRKQAKYGTAYGNRALPCAAEVSKARKEIFESGSSKSLQAIPSAIVNRFSTVGSKKTDSGKKPAVKKGALMVKTLKMMNMKRR